MLIRLLVWEGLSADYSTLLLHMQGIEAIITERGGLLHLSDQDAALAFTL